MFRIPLPRCLDDNMRRGRGKEKREERDRKMRREEREQETRGERKEKGGRGRVVPLSKSLQGGIQVHLRVQNCHDLLQALKQIKSPKYFSRLFKNEYIPLPPFLPPPSSLPPSFSPPLLLSPSMPLFIPLDYLRTVVHKT